MPVVQDSDMFQLKTPEFYNVWKGQFYIQKHLVCDIELKSSHTCSIPTQLPNKLQVKKVIRLSEIRKALPQSVFEKADFTGQEVCCERVYRSLFPVTASNAHGFELVKLLNWLRDGDLALIKTLNDQGFLILVTPSVLQCSKDLNQDSFRLYALFLFPHTRLLDRRVREDGTFSNEDLSLKITNILPGLQYAILETQQMQKERDFKLNAMVELHVKQYAHLQRNIANAGERNAIPIDGSGQPPRHEEHISEKCDQLALSCLQTYFSSPVNFSVPISKMSTLLKEDIPKSSGTEAYSKGVLLKDSFALDASLATNTIKSESSSGKSVLHENQKQPSKKRTFKKSSRRCTRKSKRKHGHQTSSEKSENPVSSKKVKLQEEEPQQVVAPSRLTVKLASAPYPPGRKRGAEVLTAEFVTDDKISLTEIVSDKRDKQQSTIVAQKITRKLREREKPPMKEPFVRPDRPPKRKASEPGYRNKLPETKTISEIIRRPMTRQKEQSESPLNKTLEVITSSESISPFRRPSLDINLSTIKQTLHPTPAPENNIMEKRINMYESHALNLLADLALNSFCSSNIPYITGESVSPKSEPLVKEKVHEGDSANAVEYPQNDCSLPVQSNTASQEPSQASECKNIPVKIGKGSSPLHTTPQQRIENSEKQTSYKVLIAAAKARARNNATSKISLEHSYSQLPKEDVPDTLSKEVTEESIQKVAEPTVTSATNVVIEPSPDGLISGDVLVQPCDNADPNVSKEPRAVSKLQDKFLITFNWDTKYDFDLDSKFTNDQLEKTINRALHGPWNPHLKEKVEDVKIILHMWLALFYSKPNQPVRSSSRKVVEHSNPAKYVSINTVLDPCFESVESDDTELNSPGTENDSDPLIDSESSMLQEMEKSNSNNLPIDLSLPSSKPKKVSFRESEHKYSKRFIDVEKILRSSSTEKAFHLLYDDAASPRNENKDISEIPDLAISSENVSLTQLRVLPLHGINEDHQPTAESESAASQKTFCFSKNYAEASPSTALNADSSSADICHQKYGLSRLSNTTKEHIAKNKSAFVSWTQHRENVLTCSEQDETIIQTAKTRIVLKPKIQKKNIDSAVDKREAVDHVFKNTKEMEISNFHLVLTDGTRSDLVISERSSRLAHDSKSSRFEESQTQSINSENLKRLANEKAPESDRGLSGDCFQSAYSERSNRQETYEDHTTKYKVLQKEIKYGNELQKIKDANTLIHLECKDNSMKEAKGDSTTHTEILGKWSEESPEGIEDPNNRKELSEMVKNVHEMATSESMSKLELSPSSDEASEVDNIDTDGASSHFQAGENVDVSRGDTGLLQIMDQKEAPDVVNTSSEQPVTVLHKDNWSVPEDNDLNKSLLTVSVTEENSQVSMVYKTDTANTAFKLG